MNNWLKWGEGHQSRDNVPLSWLSLCEADHKEFVASPEHQLERFLKKKLLITIWPPAKGASLSKCVPSFVLSREDHRATANNT